MGLTLKIYDCIIQSCFLSLKTFRKVCHVFGSPDSKLDKFISQKGKEELNIISGKISAHSEISGHSPSRRKKVIWVHASSLGEYQIARPVLRKLAQDEGLFLVLTFFSPTGTDALEGKGKEETGADIVLPLPLDTSRNANCFIDLLNPDLAVFLVSEYWPNFLSALEKKSIPTILLSALLLRPLTKQSLKDIFLKRMFLFFGTIITHDSISTANLLKAGTKNVVELPDPLFDNAIEKKNFSFKDNVIENFCRSGDILVAGSIHTDIDLEIISFLAKHCPETKIIVVPHEIDSGSLRKVTDSFPGKTLLYSSVTPESDFSACRFLVVDKIGILAYIYRYGKAAYIGGGFTRLLHSVIEPFVYGVPVAFGPEIKRKSFPTVMIENGIGTIVRSGKDLVEWWKGLNDNESLLKEIAEKSFVISDSQKGGADKIYGFIKTVLADENE